MNANQLKQALKVKGYDVGTEKSKEIHARIDHAAIVKRHRKRVNVSTITKSDLRSGRSPNNIAAETWLAQPDIAGLPDDAPILLVYIDGNLSQAQPRVPSGNHAHLTAEDADMAREGSLANRIVNELVDGYSDNEVVAQAADLAAALPSASDMLEQIQASLARIEAQISSLAGREIRGI